MTGDNSALRRRALAALILAESQHDGGHRGTRLPTERQLALDLGVSRSAIRHAMALLQAEGHVSREVGRGTFLRDAPDEAPPDASDALIAPDAPDDEALAPPETSGVEASGADDYSPADVMTVRRLFEPTAMSLVVAWATARDFEEMDRCLRGGERAADHDEFEVWDAALHDHRGDAQPAAHPAVRRDRAGPARSGVGRPEAAQRHRRPARRVPAAPRGDRGRAAAARRGSGHNSDAHAPGPGVATPAGHGVTPAE